MLYQADRILTGDGKTVLEDGALCVQNSVIRDVLPMAEADVKYPNEKKAVFDGCTILPGYVDLHVHLGSWCQRPFGYKGNDYMHAYVAMNNAAKVFANGVTTVRDVSSADGLIASLQAAKEQGLVSIALPRMVSCGNGVCMTGGHGSEFPGGGEVVDGPWAIRKAVRKKLSLGSQWIKVLTSRRAFLPEFTQEELDAAADECHRLGKKIAAHSGVPVTIQMCIDAGMDTIEHGTFMSAEQAKQMRDRNLTWVPTILPYARMYEQLQSKLSLGGELNPSERETYEFAQKADCAYREGFLRLHDTGVRVGAGTDLSIDMGLGAPVAEELLYMVRYGLTPLRAIEIATSAGAETLSLSSVTGRLKAGLTADFQVVRGNPVKAAEALRDIKRVYKEGACVYQAAEA